MNAQFMMRDGNKNRGRIIYFDLIRQICFTMCEKHNYVFSHTEQLQVFTLFLINEREKEERKIKDVRNQ